MPRLTTKANGKSSFFVSSTPWKADGSAASRSLARTKRPLVSRASRCALPSGAALRSRADQEPTTAIQLGVSACRLHAPRRRAGGRARRATSRRVFGRRCRAAADPSAARAPWPPRSDEPCPPWRSPWRTRSRAGAPGTSHHRSRAVNTALELAPRARQRAGSRVRERPGRAAPTRASRWQRHPASARSLRVRARSECLHPARASTGPDRSHASCKRSARRRPAPRAWKTKRCRASGAQGAGRAAGPYLSGCHAPAGWAKFRGSLWIRRADAPLVQ